MYNSGAMDDETVYHTMEYYSYRKMKFLGKWIELEIIEWGDRDSETHIVFSLSYINPSFFFFLNAECGTSGVLGCVLRFQRKDNESSHYVIRKAQQSGPESLCMKLHVYNTHRTHIASFLKRRILFRFHGEALRPIPREMSFNSTEHSYGWPWERRWSAIHRNQGNASLSEAFLLKGKDFWVELRPYYKMDVP